VLKSGQRPHYKVAAGASAENYQGFVIGFATGACNIYLRVDCEFQYFDPVITAPTLALKDLPEADEEKYAEARTFKLEQDDLVAFSEIVKKLETQERGVVPPLLRRN